MALGDMDALSLFSISPYQVFEAGISQFSPFPLSQIDGIAGFLLSVARDDALSCYIIFSLPFAKAYSFGNEESARDFLHDFFF